MKRIKKFSVRSKIVFVSFLLSLIFLVITLFVIISRVQLVLKDDLTNQLSNELRLITSQASTEFFSIRQDVRTLASIPELVAFLSITSTDDSSLNDQLHTFITNLFIAEGEHKQQYDQLRVFDTKGNELIRVDFEDDKSAIVFTKENLQNKANRDYFIQANTQPVGSLFTSNVSLNREGINEEIELPYQPVVRYALPLFNALGERVGLFVANVRIDMVLQKIQEAQTDSTFLVVNDQGYYLLHADSTKLWGSTEDLNSGENILKDIPSLSPNIFTESSHKQEIDNTFIFSEKIPLGSKDFPVNLILIKGKSLYAIFEPIRNLVFSVGFINMSILLGIITIFFFYVGRLLRPLKILTTSAYAIGEGNFDVRLPMNATGEIGALAVAFSKMKDKLGKQYTHFESSLIQKNTDLEKDKAELEKTRLATINVLEDLAEEKARDEAILKSLGEGLIVTNKEGKIILVNEVFTKILGFTGKEVQGKKLSEVVEMYDEHDVKIAESKRLINQALRNKYITTPKQEIKYKRKDGTLFPVFITVAPVIIDNVVSGAVEVFRDITKEDEIDKAKTEFVSLASHQLRTPLSSVNWYVEMLLDGDAGKLTEEQRTHLVEIQEGNQRMIDLVNALLNVSRLELGTFTVEPKKTNMKKLLLDVVKEEMPQILEKKISLKKKFSRNIPDIKVDPKLTWIIFQNYLSNAVKYTSKNGSVTVSLSVVKAGKKCMGKKVNEDVLCYSVADTGCGIPKNQQDKIFSKLFRADNVRSMDVSGTGLGLYVIKSILDEAGGSVGFTSTEGKGSTFFVTIPLSGMKQKKGTKKLNA